MKRKRNTIVEESIKTKKTREKLKKKLQKYDVVVSNEILKQKSLEISRWISRHAASRVPLKNKSISLFDENQNAVSVSRQISGIMEEIKKQLNVACEDCEKTKA